MHYNLLPEAFTGIYRFMRNGDTDKALRIHKAFLECADVTWECGNRESFEYLMARAGLARRCFRGPSSAIQAFDARTCSALEQRLESVKQVCAELS